MALLTYQRIAALRNLLPSIGRHNILQFSTTPCVWNLDPNRSRFYPIKTDIMLPANCFAGKVAMVTGGGTGLGKGMTYTLSALGAKVMICSRNLEVLKKTAEEISSQTKNEVLAVSADVRNPEAIKSAVDECVAKFGLPTIVINNAAGNFICPTEMMSPNAFKTVIDIVLNGTAFTTLEVGKRLIEAKTGGVFLQITALFAETGSGFVTHSASAKAGVEALSKSLGAEWGRYGIRFNCIEPGGIETKGAFSRLSPDGMEMKRFKDRIPAGRTGHIAELSNLAAYLVSDYSSWMNGSIIKLDGGEQINISGSFNSLQEVSNQQWKDIIAKIRQVKGS